MQRFTVWLQHHRLSAFFILAYAISWSSWPFHAFGLVPRMEFLAIGPLIAALLVTGLAWGRSGLKAWAGRLIRWRVGWIWYAVALLLPALMALVAGFANIALGAPVSGLPEAAWTGLLAAFALRLVNPMDAPLGEEAGFRGYAVPVLQTRSTPLATAAILGILVSGWHLPLVVFGHLSLIGLPTTFVITFLFVWLFNRTGGSALLTLLFHSSQATFTVDSFGFSGTDTGRAELIYLGIVLAAALATILVDRDAWYEAPASAVGLRP